MTSDGLRTAPVLALGLSVEKKTAPMRSLCGSMLTIDATGLVGALLHSPTQARPPAAGHSEPPPRHSRNDR